MRPAATSHTIEQGLAVVREVRKLVSISNPRHYVRNLKRNGPDNIKVESKGWWGLKLKQPLKWGKMPPVAGRSSRHSGLATNMGIAVDGGNPRSPLFACCRNDGITALFDANYKLESDILNNGAGPKAMPIWGVVCHPDTPDVTKRLRVLKPVGLLTTPLATTAVFVRGVSENGGLVGVGSMARRFDLWDVRTSHMISSLTDLSSPVRSVCCLREGVVALGLHDGSAALYDLRLPSDSYEVLCAPLNNELRHHGAILAIATLPNRGRLVTGGQDRTVRVWDVRQPCQALQSLTDFAGGLPAPSHAQAVKAFAVSEDGKFLLSRGGGGLRDIRLWDTGCGIGDKISLVNVRCGQDDLMPESMLYGSPSLACCFLDRCEMFAIQGCMRPLVAVGVSGGEVSVVELYSGRSCMKLDGHTRDIPLLAHEESRSTRTTVRYNFGVPSQSSLRAPYFDPRCIPSVLYHRAIGFLVAPDKGDVCVYHVNELPQVRREFSNVRTSEGQSGVQVVSAEYD